MTSKTNIVLLIGAASLMLSFSALAGTAMAQTASNAALDTLVFGDTVSEKAHALDSQNTKIVVGALGEVARVSLPKTPIDYYGGDLTFELKIDPVKQNYFTVKLWGDDINNNQKALLYINGEQLGYRHMGDYEALNHGASAPSFRGRFFYQTNILPLAVTHGRRKLTLTIKTIGPIAGYSLMGGYDGYQMKMDTASRGYYRAYTHTNPAQWGQESEKQGAAPATPAIRPMQDESKILAEKRQGTIDYVNDRISDQGRMQPKDINGLAGALSLSWTPAGRDATSRQKTITQLIAKIDDQAQRNIEPDIYAKGSYQSDWGGHFAPIGEAIHRMNRFLTATQWQTILDETIALNGEKVTRREAWTRMLKGNFDYARTHLARISNQAMFCLMGAYQSNCGLQIINPAVAEPEATAKRFLFQASGVWPYRGNDILDANGKLIGHEDVFGEHYFQITAKGLTREFTYVAIYGEGANDLVHYYEEYGYDEILKKALLSSEARAQMKHADFDDEGYRAMRMEGVIESRGPAYPDSVGYGTRQNNGHGMLLSRLKRLMERDPSRYSGAAWAPYWKMATNAVGYAQQMLRDNQYLDNISDGEAVDDYRYVKDHPIVGVVLPMTYLKWYSPQELANLQKAGLKLTDYQRRAWSDEDDGIVALRDGDLTMFVSLIQKGNWGVNGVSRVHCISPTYDRLATVAPDIQFDWDGQYYVRPDWTNVQFTNANNAPEKPFQVMQGEVLPIATQPNVKVAQPVDTPYAGYGNFYSLRYGPYLIGQNTTRAVYGNARTYELKLPASFKDSQTFDFISGQKIAVKNGSIAVFPQSTVVVKLDSAADERPPMASRLVAVFGGAKGTTIRWSHAGGATKYIIKRASSKAGPFIKIGETQGENLFMDTAGKASDFYTVAGQNENGIGLDAPATPILAGNPLQTIAAIKPKAIVDDITNWLDKKPADLNAPPAAPRDLDGENIKRRVSLAWEVAKNGVTYEVLRAETPNGPFLPVATNLSSPFWNEDGLKFGQTYFYRVVSLNRKGVRGPQSNTVKFAPVDDTLSKPWKGADIGDVGSEGSDGLLNGTLSIRGSGGDVWGNDDQFRYVFQLLQGDGEIVARVVSQQNTSEWTKSGLMIRESMAQNAKNAFVFVTPGHGVKFQTRSDTGGGTNSPGEAESAVPIWLKLTRTGNIFTASTSKDGQMWTSIGTAKIAMENSVIVGLAVNAHSKGAINLTRFDGVRFGG